MEDVVPRLTMGRPEGLSSLERPARHDTTITLNVLSVAGYADGNYDCTFSPARLKCPELVLSTFPEAPNLAALVLAFRSTHV